MRGLPASLRESGEMLDLPEDGRLRRWRRAGRVPYPGNERGMA